jgi:hypothetical protein
MAKSLSLSQWALGYEAVKPALDSAMPQLEPPVVRRGGPDRSRINIGPAIKAGPFCYPRRYPEVIFVT